MASTEDLFTTPGSTGGDAQPVAPQDTPQDGAPGDREAAPAPADVKSTDPDGAASAEEPRKPPRKRAPRRPTKRTAAQPDGAPGADAALGDRAAADEASQEGPATGTAADADAAATAADAGAAATAADAAATATAAPASAPRARRSRSSKKSAAVEPSSTSTPSRVEPAGPELWALEPAGAELPALELAEDEEGVESFQPVDDEQLDATQRLAPTSGGSATGAAAPAAPAFGLIFQPPEPAVVADRAARGSRPADEVPTDLEEPLARGEGAGAVGHVEEPERDEEPDRDEDEDGPRRRRRSRGGKGRRGRAGDADRDDSPVDDESPAARADTDADATPTGASTEADDGGEEGDGDTEPGGEGGSRRRTRRRRRGGSTGEAEETPGVVTRIREPRKDRDEPQSLKGSTRLEAKKQRRREGREAGRRRTIITEAEFLARRESVERVMVVRNTEARTQIGVLEDGVLVEHYVSRETNASMAGNVYLGRVQNVLPSMEAAFVDIGKGRNAVLYAGEVNWDAAGLEGNQPRRIENALSSGDSVLVQVTKDPIGHKGARLTSQISLPGRYLVYVPEGHMTGISRKLPDTERARLKQILKEVVPDSAGVIVRTAAEGASEEELRADVERLTRTWEKIQQKAKSAGKGKGSNAPVLVHGEPDLTVRVIRDVFNEDFTSLVVAGQQAWDQVSDYIGDVAPDLAGRLSRWTSEEDLFTHYRVDEQIAKAMDRKVWLPSGGSLVIDRTEAMTVIDVNTGKFVGSGGNLEETVTKNNVEAAEEIVRQLRLRDIGGIIVIDFIDMVLESNRDLVVRRLLECLGRDRTKHQVAEVTSLGLVQMTRKRVGSGLIEVFSEPCEHCHGRGFIIHAEPVDRPAGDGGDGASRGGRSRRGKSGGSPSRQPEQPQPAQPQPTPSGPTPAQIAAAAHAAALKSSGGEHGADTDEHAAPGMPEAVAQDGQGDHDREATVLDAVEPAGVEEPRDPKAADAVEPEAARGGAQPAYGTEQPAPRRRKRGRVVAPAGPPRGSAPAETVVTLPAGASEEE